MRFFACSVKIRISKLPKWLPCCDIVRIITTWLWGSLTNPWFCWMFFAYRPLRVPIYLGRPILAWLRPSRPREGICIGKKEGDEWRWWSGGFSTNMLHVYPFNPEKKWVEPFWRLKIIRFCWVHLRNSIKIRVSGSMSTFRNMRF